MEKLEISKPTPKTPEFVGETEAPVFIPANQEASTDPDTTAQIEEIEKQIAATLQSTGTPEASDMQEHQDKHPLLTESEPTFLDRHPTLGKWTRSMMLVAGLGVAGAAFGADKNSVEKLEGSEVVTNVIVNGKQVSSVKNQQKKTIIGATITKDGKTIIVNGKSTPYQKNSSVSVSQKAGVVTEPLVGVELK